MTAVEAEKLGYTFIGSVWPDNEGNIDTIWCDEIKDRYRGANYVIVENADNIWKDANVFGIYGNEVFSFVDNYNEDLITEQLTSLKNEINDLTDRYKEMLSTRIKLLALRK